MDRKLKELLKENNLLLKFMPLHTKGCLIHNKGKFPDVIVLNSTLSNQEVDKVVLHELGHYKYDKNTVGNYKNNSNSRLCSECNANRYVVKEIIKYYVALGHDIETVNYVALAKYIGVRDPLMVKEELSEYLN